MKSLNYFMVLKKNSFIILSLLNFLLQRYAHYLYSFIPQIRNVLPFMRTTAVRHPQLVINDYCQKDLYIVHLQREIK